MRSLRLISIEPALLRLKASNHSGFAKLCTSFLLLMLVSAATLTASAQDREQTWGDSSTPLVYSVENTGARYPAPNFPSFAQLPIIRPLPDPFQFNEGWRDQSFPNWERRRNEIMAADEKYELGVKPDCHDCTITANYVPPASATANGTLTVNVTRNGKTLTLTSGVFIPQGAGPGPYPALIPMEISFCFSFGGTPFCFPPPTQPDYGSLPPAVFTGLPIATVGYVSTQVTAYNFTSPSDHTTDPFYQLYPEYCEGICTNGSNQGEYAAWSWGISRLIDGMEIATHQANNPLPIDMKHLAVTGCSFAGKMALYAGAYDERIALTIAQENGGGGAPAWRVSHDIEAQGTVEDIDDTNYDWFAGQMLQFAGDNVYKLPIDQHELMAMVAPRALLQTGNASQYWLSNGSAYVSSRATQRIYNALGIGDRFGFFIDGSHAHCATNAIENAPLTAFIDKFMLGQATVNTDVEVIPTPANAGSPITVAGGAYAYDFATMNYKRWTDWWGTGDPVFPDNWNTGGTVVASLGLGPFGLLPPLEVNSGDTIEGGYEMSLGGRQHPAATVSLVAGGKISADIICQGGNSYTLDIPLPAQSYSIAAGDNSWQPPLKFGAPPSFQGSTTATPVTGVAECVRGRTTNAYFSATGLSEGGDGNPGGPGLLTTDVTDPLSLIFNIGDQNSGRATFYNFPVVVNWNPLTSADATDQNPVTTP
ncbi:MAG TPA: hypothetical protein VGG45_06000 [Terracidiphilus sp.]|jgi:hypothetical protein